MWPPLSARTLNNTEINFQGAVACPGSIEVHHNRSSLHMLLSVIAFICGAELCKHVQKGERETAKKIAYIFI